MSFTKRWFWLAASGALFGTSCGGSNAKYIRIGFAAPSAVAGTNCTTNAQNNNTSYTDTVTGETAEQTWVIYQGPANVYLLDVGTAGISFSTLQMASLPSGLKGGTLLNGSLSGSTYTFKGSSTDDQKAGTVNGNQETQTEVDTSVTITTSGSGVTGTIAFSLTCQGATSECNSFSQYSCSSSAPLTGSIISAQEANTVSASDGTH